MVAVISVPRPAAVHAAPFAVVLSRPLRQRTASLVNLVSAQAEGLVLAVPGATTWSRGTRPRASGTFVPFRTAPHSASTALMVRAATMDRAVPDARRLRVPSSAATGLDQLAVR